MRFFIATLAAATLAACVANPVYRQSAAPLPVASIDRDRYLGLWHEQARLPNSFEEGCVHVTAEYGMRADGFISVRNSCREADGRLRVATGRARAAGDANEGKLEVSFFGPFWGDYWVLERADDYSWSLVGEPSGRFFWLLTRAEQISEDERADFERRMRALGYDPSVMIWRE
jgi:apolipoprotein D and lipocalin family protein